MPIPCQVKSGVTTISTDEISTLGSARIGCLCSGGYDGRMEGY